MNLCVQPHRGKSAGENGRIKEEARHAMQVPYNLTLGTKLHYFITRTTCSVHGKFSIRLHLNSGLQTISCLRVSLIFVYRLLAFISVSNVCVKHDLNLQNDSYELGYNFRFVGDTNNVHVFPVVQLAVFFMRRQTSVDGNWSALLHE